MSETAIPDIISEAELNMELAVEYVKEAFTAIRTGPGAPGDVRQDHRRDYTVPRPRCSSSPPSRCLRLGWS